MINKIRCVIVDDEQHASKLLETYISSIPTLELVSIYSDPIKALAGITKKDNIDIAFLDIEMPDLSGIDLAASIKSKIGSIIFTTAYKDYAVDAFDLRANHFLVKPIRQAKFVKAVMDIIDDDLPRLEKIDKDFLFFKTGEKGKLTRVKKQDIIYFEGAGNYVKMVTTSFDQLIYLTLHEVQQLFKADAFFRIHRSYVVNAGKIISTSGNMLEFETSHKLQMSDFYKEDIIDFLKYYTIETGRLKN
ncbi:LytTR family DNA-binding domain-containing protein [Pedobacter sp. Leaf250]|uniref:LytR/AlgR family response regulator transcription factor n=1 Tax=Pedobacter sp. Leaf250 TaxID=2876559 RepID=UPI001E3C08F3|nr:LytTR family DNA-binding domain-containing protein [Pedobacter sp. Leaf250]